ncbi:MAG: FkbM family methyltransferase [Halioglobus sp.]
MQILPSPYQVKKALMMPYTAYKRRQENVDGFVRSALEVHYYRPTFYEWLGAVKETPDLLYLADLDSDSIVLDVGACFGEWAEEIAKRYDPTVLSFEPDPVNFQRLVETAQHYPRIRALEYGVGAKSETVQMSLEFLGSTVYNSPRSKKKQRFADVRIVDIEEAWQELGLDRVDLMKINIEGAEFPLLEKMLEAGMMDRVDTFLIQFHEWHPGAYSRRKKIQNALRSTHHCDWDYHFIWEKWSRR